jgi:hypothetical protein
VAFSSCYAILIDAAAADHESFARKLAEHLLEAAEVPRQQGIQRPSLRAGGAHPAAQHRVADLLVRVGGQRQQDRQLRPVLELATDQLEWVGVERRAELLVG